MDPQPDRSFARIMQHAEASLKRKAPDDRVDDRERLRNSTHNLPPKGEYESGQVNCAMCGEGVSFKDTATGGFTLRHWDNHRQRCSKTSHHSSEPVIYTPESTAEALANPPTKRRRAKRTEEERIKYLRADPYVAQFEAYRVLCGSCDKWIRLRPNSTYCSIPWDAHRKSCLSKKINKNVYALEERNSLFAKDPDIRKFDSERILCNICHRWLSISPDDHLHAVQNWLNHRSYCQRSEVGLTGPPLPPAAVSPQSPYMNKFETVPPRTEQQLSLASHPLPRHPAPLNPPHPTSVPRPPASLSSPSPPSKSPYPSSSHSHRDTYPSAPHAPPPSSAPTFHEFSPLTTNHSSSSPPSHHESRRRNAEHRAATLNADPLISEVEPNRVFCTLCRKWVQLRQDSSYCAYPWLQHRGKCLARHCRKEQQMLSRSMGAGMSADDAGSESNLESEESVHSNDEGGGDEDHARRKRHRLEEPIRTNGTEHRGRDLMPSVRQFSPSSFTRREEHGRGDRGRQVETAPWSGAEGSNGNGHGRGSAASSNPNGWRGEDRGGVVEKLPSVGEHGDRVHWNRYHRAVAKPKHPAYLADLDSPSGRKNFIYASIDYLFMTTYETSDDMTISALLTFLNAAMPPDKHEDFDTAEVVKAVAALTKERGGGSIVFEGDMLRLVP